MCRMYLVTATNDRVQYEATYFYVKSALEVIEFLHDTYPNLKITLKSVPNLDTCLYKYVIDGVEYA